MNYIPEAFVFKNEEAVSIGWCTCLGRNNCFSVHTKEGNEYSVVNFYFETLEELLKTIPWSIKIAVIGKDVCVINDPRIEDKHYRKEFCTVCCPMDLLPIHQRLAQARRIDRGEVSYTKTKDMLIESCTIKFDPAPSLFYNKTKGE